TNPFGAYICFGFMALILIHTFQNIGMTIGIMPITGIPLLFVSYGGSTILSTMIGLALVYRVAVEESKQQEFIFYLKNFLQRIKSSVHKLFCDLKYILSPVCTSYNWFTVCATYICNSVHTSIKLLTFARFSSTWLAKSRSR